MDSPDVDALLDTLGTQARRGTQTSHYPPPHEHYYQHAYNDNQEGWYEDLVPVYEQEGQAVYRHQGQSQYDIAEPSLFDDGQDYPRDAFDESLLRARDDDRQQLAEAGRARLSLGPRSSTYGSGRLGQAYLAPQASSSPKGLPSSPAVGASQRRRSNPQSGYQTEQHGTQDSRQSQLIPTVRRPQPSQSQVMRNQIDLPHAPPMAQGIELIPIRQLPDRFRSIFSFPLFNAVQSKCFNTIYGSDDNFVVSAPTGSGKTVIFELAVLRTMNSYTNGQYKIVYQAPTKSLCSERQRDWQKKFGPLDLTCAELTGDSDSAQLRNVQKASIIITTPEKWDSMTRKWKDQEKLMQMVKLFLIDEVHILKEDRGATLEAVVSRMKSIDSRVRFIAVSATVPNFADIATWLGKDSTNPDLPAVKERFGEEFRPVKLQKHVLGFQGNSNDFAFDKSLSNRLPEVISRYSQRKPIMIFCVTRPSCVKTARHLADWWCSKGPRDRFWEAPTRKIRLNNRELSECVSAGVAYHHAGLDLADRQAVEQGFLSSDISVICCTSTLAVGVNLPCHFVILKNTVSWSNTGIKEYSDIEVIQMLGRAGRPQFDNSAVAVIMTKTEKVRHYDKLSSGQEILESCLHTNLIEHLNAEIGLGTITNIGSAMRWLEGTFLYVRLRQNPAHYKLGDSGSGNDIQQRLQNICNRGISSLEEWELVRRERKLVSTEFGDAMARYYVRFETMKVFLSIPNQARLSEILSALVQATEFQEIRFRSGEKPLYKKLNTMPSIKFPIPVNLDAPAHKASLVVQSVLGGAELPVDENGYNHQQQYNTDVMTMSQHAHRLIRCIIDCSLQKADSITIRNALSLARSLSAKCWDDSPLQLKQLEGIGPVAVRKLVNANIKSIEALENAEPHRIETILSKGPTFGLKLMDMLKRFPKLRVAMKQTRVAPSKTDGAATVGIKAEIGFMNEKVPETFNRSVIYVCMLAETSDGKMIYFRRISAKKLADGQEVLFEAELTTVNQVINCYVMCEEIVGTMRQVTLVPKLPPHLISRLKQKSEEARKAPETKQKPGANISRRRRESENSTNRRSTTGSDDYGYGDLDDSELLAAGGTAENEYTHIDDIESEDSSTVLQRRKFGDSKRVQIAKSSKSTDNDDWRPTQLWNGKWECNHACKNKKTCKHICCREGLDKPPKGPSKAKKAEQGEEKSTLTKWSKLLNSQAAKPNRRTSSNTEEIEQLDLTQRIMGHHNDRKGPNPFGGSNKLHQKHTGTLPVAPRRMLPPSPKPSYASGVPSRPSFLSDPRPKATEQSSDYGDGWMDSLNLDDGLGHEDVAGTMDLAESHDTVDNMFDKDSQLEDAMVGIVDSQNLPGRKPAAEKDNIAAGQNSTDYGAIDDLPDPMDISGHSAHSKKAEKSTRSEEPLFVTNTSSSVGDMIPEQSMPEAGSSAFFEKSSSTLKEDGPVHPEDFRQGPQILQKRKQTASESDLTPLAPPVSKKVKEKEWTGEARSASATLVEKSATSADDDGSKAKNLETTAGEKAVPTGYEGLDPWLLEEFGDIIEIV